MASILENLKSEDESQQLMAALELAETLLMSEEDLLYSLPLPNLISTLINILNKDHNPELVMAAARCFIGILEVSPQMSARMSAAVPVFVSKLGQMEYIDLVEICLSILDRLSRSYGHQIVTSGCMSTIQMYFDFFSLETQGTIFRVMANCAHFIRSDELNAHISHEMIGAFGQRMCLVKNKTCLETLCTFFIRVVENSAQNVDVLRSHFGIKNDFLHCILSTLHHRAVEVGGGANLLRLLEIVSRRCRDLAVELVRLNVAEMLHLLLCGSEMNAMEMSAQKKVELTSQRPSNQICQIIRLFCDLLPQLPNDGLFAINSVLVHYPTILSALPSGTNPSANSLGVASMRILSAVGSSSSYQWFMKRDTEYQTFSDMSGEEEEDTDREDGNDNNSEEEEDEEENADTPGPSSAIRDKNGNSSDEKKQDEKETVITSKLRNEPKADNSTAAAPLPPVGAAASRSHSAPSGFNDWSALQAQDSVMLELSYAEFGNQDDEEEMTVQMLGGEEFYLDLTEMACYHYHSNARYQLERRFCQPKDDDQSAKNQKDEHYVDERELFRSSGESGYAKLMSLFPLLVDIGNVSTCASVRFSVLCALSRALHACADSSEHFSDLLKDVALSSFISGTLNGHNKNLSMVGVSVQIVRQVLDNLPDVYMSLFESEGVLHEIRNYLQRNKPAYEAKLSSSKINAVLGTSKNSKTSKSAAKAKRRRSKSRKQNAQTGVSSSNETVASVTSNVSAATAKCTTAPTSLNTPVQPAKCHKEQTFRELKAQLEEALSTFIYKQCTEIIAVVDAYQNKIADLVDKPTYSPNTSYRLLCSIAGQLTAVDEDVGVEPLLKLRELLTNVNISGVTGFQFNQSGILHAINRYLTEESRRKSANVDGVLLPSRTERLRRFIEVFTGNFFKTPLTEKLGSDENAESFKNLVQSVVSTLGQFERFPIRATTASFIEEDNTLSPSFNIAEQTLRVIQRKQLYCSLKPHESHKSSTEKEMSHERISVRPLSSVFMLESFVSENMYISAVKASSLVSLSTTQSNLSMAASSGSDESNSEPSTSGNNSNGAVSDVATSSAGGSNLVAPTDGNTPASGGSTVESRKSSTTSFGSSTDGDEWRSRASSVIGRVEMFYESHKLSPTMSILQAIVQHSTDSSDGGSEVIPESIWTRNHIFHYRVILEDPQTSASSSSAAAAPSSNEAPNSAEAGRMSTVSLSESSAADDTDRRLSPPCSKMAKVDILHPSLSIFDHDMDVDDADADGKSMAKSLLECYLDVAISDMAGQKFGEDPSIDCLLALLKTLYGVNTLAWSLRNVASDTPDFMHKSPILPNADFYVNKLDSKVARQLSDVLCVVTERLPKWLNLLVTKLPFVFQFSTRVSFLHTTTFGNARAMRYLLHENKVNRTRFSKLLLCKLVAEIPLRKVTVKRADLLEEAVKIFGQTEHSGNLLDVQFEGEVGSGHGPTLEFYSSLSSELQRHSLNLWSGVAVAERIEEQNNPEYKNYFTVAESGLYPRMWLPTDEDKDVKMEMMERQQQLKHFEFVGRLLAQALIDNRLLDIPLAPSLFKWLLNDEDSINFETDFASIEPTIFNSFVNLIDASPFDFEAMQMTFIYPGTEFELLKDGASVVVTRENFHQFVQLVTDWRLRYGVREQMRALRDGFCAILKADAQLPRIFDVQELEQIFGGSADSGDTTDERVHALWSTDALFRNFHVDHGYSTKSPQVKWLAQMLNDFVTEQRRKFLQFVTGSPRLPIGGFAALSPPLTVVRKVVNDPLELPSAMTCFNYLKLPAYETYEQLVERFLVALEFTHSFHLS